MILIRDVANLNSLPILTLKRRGSELAVAAKQVQILEQPSSLSRFGDVMTQNGLRPLVADGIDILQVNVGKLCNMTCQHCHVDAGPDRKQENMSAETVEHCLPALRSGKIKTLDLTGGAPEMNPHFKHFVTAARKFGCHVIDRCNLTILLAQGFTGIASFLADHQVEIVASLPCYRQENADAQRGDGAFQKSIEALQQLNRLGYGHSGFRFDVDAGLQSCRSQPCRRIKPDLEPKYREVLRDEYGVHFNRLFTITNMPISRYLDHLLETGEYETYLQKLIDAFNPAAAKGVMCRKLISVGWDGRLYDCDFNQMLGLSTTAGQPSHIRDFDFDPVVQSQNSHRSALFRLHRGCRVGMLRGDWPVVWDEPN